MLYFGQSYKNLKPSFLATFSHGRDYAMGPRTYVELQVEE
jgi:hypothetical protein